jgi:hypothetical protein
MNCKKKTHAAIALMIVFALLLSGCASGAAPFGDGESEDGNSSALQDKQIECIDVLDQSPANPDEISTAASQSEDGENQGPIQSSEMASTMEAYKSVLQGNSKFFSTDVNSDLNISQLSLAVSDDSNVTASATKFAIVDLDNDGTPEIILRLAVSFDDYYGFEVFRCQNGAIYGYTLYYRSFMGLKANGTFSFSSGAADNGFGRVTFTETAYTIDEITYCESSYDSNNNMSVLYFVNQQNATEAEFLSAVNRQGEEPDAIWYDFTDENIETKVSMD